jgi:hypothetical protein
MLITGTTNMRYLALAHAPQTMKKLLLPVGIALAMGGATPFAFVPAYAFTKPAPVQIDNYMSLECSVVGQRPAGYDRDPVYKININLQTADNGEFQSFDVVHTVRSGAAYDRTQQYTNATIWKTSNRAEWYWKGYHGRAMMIGEVYHNDRDGWMYMETHYSGNNQLDFQMLADCHRNEMGRE